MFLKQILPVESSAPLRGGGAGGQYICKIEEPADTLFAWDFTTLQLQGGPAWGKADCSNKICRDYQTQYIVDLSTTTTNHNAF